jgi:hypothetical protein
MDVPLVGLDLGAQNKVTSACIVVKKLFVYNSLQNIAHILVEPVGLADSRVFAGGFAGYWFGSATAMRAPSFATKLRGAARLGR